MATRARNDGPTIPTYITDLNGDSCMDETNDALKVAIAQLAAAVLAADNLALPTTSEMLAVLQGYDGTNLDLIRTSSIGSGILRTTQEFSYLNIAAGQATTVVKASPGILHSICLNSAATAANVTTVYDNASGSGLVIAIPNVVAATVPTTLIFDVKFTLGLTIITGTANGGNMTVCYA